MAAVKDFNKFTDQDMDQFFGKMFANKTPKPKKKGILETVISFISSKIVIV